MRRLLPVAVLTLCTCARGYVHVDATGRLWIGKEPSYPIGLCDVPARDLEEAARAGFNTVTVREAVPEANPEVLLETLDRAASLGLRVILPVDFPHARLVAVPALNSHAALLCWQLAWTPERLVKNPHLVADAYRRTLRADDEHPILVVLSEPPFATYGQFGRVIGLACFPVPARPLTHVPAALVWARDQTSKMALWSLIQIVPVPGDFSGPAPRRPTYAEIRCMSFLALLHGARGLLFWNAEGGGLRASEPGLWKSLGRLVRELRILSGILPFENAGEITIELLPEAPKIHAALRRAGSDYYLLLANPFPQPGRARLCMPYWPGPRVLDVELKPFEAGCRKLSGSGALEPFPTDIPDEWPVGPIPTGPPRK